MKLLQVVADGAPGGGTTVVLELCRALVEGGHDVHVVTDSESHLFHQALSHGAEARGFSFFRKRQVAHLRKKLVECVREIRPDVVHLHGLRASFLFGPMAPQLLPARIHYTVHGYHFEHKGRARKLLGLWAERYASRKLRSFVFVCHYDLKLGTALGVVPAGAKTVVIPNGVSSSSLPVAKADASPAVCYLARLVEQKDPLLMVQIAGALARKGISTDLVGGGPLQGRVRQAIDADGFSDRVRIRGDCGREHALSILAKAHAMILPSRWEGFPVACLEAMAIGVPVVASDVCGIPEMIRSGLEGILIKKRDPELFAEAVCSVVRNPELRTSIVENARKRVQSEFSVEKFLRRHADLYGLSLPDKSRP